MNIGAIAVSESHGYAKFVCHLLEPKFIASISVKYGLCWTNSEILHFTDAVIQIQVGLAYAVFAAQIINTLAIDLQPSAKVGTKLPNLEG